MTHKRDATRRGTNANNYAARQGNVSETKKRHSPYNAQGNPSLPFLLPPPPLPSRPASATPIMAQSKPSTQPSPDDVDPGSPPRSPRKPRQDYRQLNHMRAPNRSAEQIAAEKADKEQRQRDKVTKKKKNTTNLAQFENDAVNELLQKGGRAARPPAPTQHKAPRAVAQVDTVPKPSVTAASKAAKVGHLLFYRGEQCTLLTLIRFGRRETSTSTRMRCHPRKKCPPRTNSTKSPTTQTRSRMWPLRTMTTTTTTNHNHRPQRPPPQRNPSPERSSTKMSRILVLGSTITAVKLTANRSQTRIVFFYHLSTLFCDTYMLTIMTRPLPSDPRITKPRARRVVFVQHTRPLRRLAIDLLRAPAEDLWPPSQPTSKHALEESWTLTRTRMMQRSMNLRRRPMERRLGQLLRCALSFSLLQGPLASRIAALTTLISLFSLCICIVHRYCHSSRPGSKGLHSHKEREIISAIDSCQAQRSSRACSQFLFHPISSPGPRPLRCRSRHRQSVQNQ